MFLRSVVEVFTKKRELVIGIYFVIHRHSSSLTDAEAYGRPKQQPSFLKSDVLPVFQLLGVALSQKSALGDDNKSTLNRLFQSDPCHAAFKQSTEKTFYYFACNSRSIYAHLFFKL